MSVTVKTETRVENVENRPNPINFLLDNMDHARAMSFFVTPEELEAVPRDHQYIDRDGQHFICLRTSLAQKVHNGKTVDLKRWGKCQLRYGGAVYNGIDSRYDESSVNYQAVLAIEQDEFFGLLDRDEQLTDALDGEAIG